MFSVTAVVVVMLPTLHRNLVSACVAHFVLGGCRNPLWRGNRERGQDYPVDANGPEEKGEKEDGEKAEKQPE